jgi:hypothetical protein
MAAGDIHLFSIASTLEALEMMTELELSKPPGLLFENRTEISQVYQSLSPKEWAVDDVRLPPSGCVFPEAKIISRSNEFAPDYFLLSYDFVSKSLRDILQEFSDHIKYIDIQAEGSSETFLDMDYKMMISPSLSPFNRMYSDIVMEYFSKGEYPPKFSIRDNFEPISPIFSLATGPWLMCTEEIVAAVMPHPISGLSFVNYETDEVLIAGT